MTFAYIRKYYGVSFKRGDKVRVYDGSIGRIISARNQYLRIRFDDGKVGLFHPTWEMTYLKEQK